MCCGGAAKIAVLHGDRQKWAEKHEIEAAEIWVLVAQVWT
jgi:hypothetical protein